MAKVRRCKADGFETGNFGITPLAPEIPSNLMVSALKRPSASTMLIEELQVKLEERANGLLAFVDDAGRAWAQCAPSSHSVRDYVVEGPLSGFVFEEGTFTTKSEQEFRDWLGDRLIDDELFVARDREAALEIANRIAEAAQRILKDR